jgi:asparagine synthase (glutamine-hydrolysing)
MCGIAGKLNLNGSPVDRAVVTAMLESIRHRGPDGDGIYLKQNVALGHRRLAIIDLHTGQQPLANEDDTVWITFNGEIYNYQELRADLLTRGHRLRTQSDTEVIVHLYEEYGSECVQKLRGMFAFAIWDERKQTLFIARDRVGIKPLYYRLGKDSFSFASEIKAILADPEVKAEIAPALIDRFLTFDYNPGEETLFQGIRKLPPGSHLTVKGGKLSIQQYWDLQFVRDPVKLEEAQERLLALLDECVRLHMIADVPVGFLLSGGVDSTAMLSLAQGKSEQKLSSYTLGFTAAGIPDERPFARLAAKVNHSDHHEMTITADDFRNFLPSYIWHMEEPVCEPPAVALYYVSRLAKQFVKVLISGEGGDEAFGGYQTYRNILWLERLKSALGPAKGAFGSTLSLMNRAFRVGKIDDYMPLFNSEFDSYYYSRTSSPFRFFNSPLTSIYSCDFSATVNKQESAQTVTRYLTSQDNGLDGDRVNRMLYVDTKTWLPDDLLLKADKMTMANSVELRVPLLDHKLLEFAASLPGNYKVRGFTTKYIAKKTLNARVPEEIVKRKKAGFPVPYASWMRHELRDWVNSVVLDSKTLSRGYFDQQKVEKLLAEQQATGQYSKEVFSLVTLELWHRAFLP